MNNDLQIVRKVVSKGREFYAKGIYCIANSLKECNDAGYQPLFMPELAMARADADKDSRLWQAWFLSPSVRVTGRSKGGNPVVAYAHVPTSLSDPANIRKFIAERALFNGAGPMPQEEFYALLGQEGNGRVFVVNYYRLRESISEVINVNNALAHPQVIPFLGGEQNAQVYLAKYKGIHGNGIGVWHSDDLKDRPMGRVLFVGDSGDGNGLGGVNYSCSDGRFAGVVPEAQVVREKEGLEGTVEVLSEGKFLRRGGILYAPVPEGLEL